VYKEERNTASIRRCEMCDIIIFPYMRIKYDDSLFDPEHFSQQELRKELPPDIRNFPDGRPMYFDKNGKLLPLPTELALVDGVTTSSNAS
jgi:hypothetical protein